MDRELLLEIGTEEIPASWLPGLTAQLGTVLEAKLKEARLSTDEPIETYSTPRRLTVRSARISERQSDLEELVTGPPVSAAFGADGRLTPAGAGFVKKQGATEDQIERVQTPKGEYIGVRKHQRGKAAVDVLPEVLNNVLRGMSFPKQMRWDAMLNDGKGELPFGRPIRWILYLFGGRVVPFTIGRSPLASGSRVQEISTGASTYGHRFLTTSGRAGRAVKVKHFDDYRKRLAEHFVVIDRSERHDRIARELDAESRRRGGRIARSLVGQGMLDEVPDLVEYPVVASGSFSDEFLRLPEEVLTTTMIHHQHFFPVVSDQGKLLPVFLAVLNMEPDQPEIVSRNMERVLTARLRDAQFFYQSDRQQPLASHQKRLDTVLFHKKIGTYLQKSERVAETGRGDRGEGVQGAAGRNICAGSGTALQGRSGDRHGARAHRTSGHDGRHLRPRGWPARGGLEGDLLPLPPCGRRSDGAARRKEQLGKAAVTWAAVSLADKLDTVISMFAAGERPTGSRDPYGLRRAAQGIVRILVDLPELTGLDLRLTLADLRRRGRPDEAFWSFMADRIRFVLEQRGYDPRNVRAVTHGDAADRAPAGCEAKAGDAPRVHRVRPSSSSSLVSSSAFVTLRRTSNPQLQILAASSPRRLRSRWRKKSIALRRWSRRPWRQAADTARRLRKRRKPVRL